VDRSPAGISSKTTRFRSDTFLLWRPQLDRKILKLPFTENRTPDWVCPTCEKGVLRIKKGTFFKEEGCESRDHSEEAWEPEWIRYVYSCLLVCTNDQCAEVVSSSGVGSVQGGMYFDEHGDPQEDYQDIFRPKFFEPHLKLIDIPGKCPKSVSRPLHQSCRLFFVSPSAASNSVRVAIEELLTDMKVKRYDVQGGKRRFISLHQRIGMMPAKYKEIKDIILAIKWLGNAGSHGDNSAAAVSMDDVLDSYEFTEHILQEIYTSKSKKLAALAKKVNKKKGPVKAA
jgi:Domain of unknown function (DUF4145)